MFRKAGRIAQQTANVLVEARNLQIEEPGAKELVLEVADGLGELLQQGVDDAGRSPPKLPFIFGVVKTTGSSSPALGLVGSNRCRKSCSSPSAP